jgi:hypothetical protein
MSEQRRQVLEMLAEGKVTADEAERLIGALESQEPVVRGPVAQSSAVREKPKPRYLRIVVEDTSSAGDEPTRVNVRVPLQLLRAGVRLVSIVPPKALAKVNEELADSGMPIDLTELKPQQLEELVDHLDELTIDVDDRTAKVRVFCE